MKEPGRRDITPKRKPGFRIQPSVGSQGMTIGQPFRTPVPEAEATPAEEAPATEVADLVTPPEPAATHEAEPPAENGFVADYQDYTQYQSPSPATPAKSGMYEGEIAPLSSDPADERLTTDVPTDSLVLQHEAGTLDYQEAEDYAAAPLTQSEYDYDTAGSEYQTPVTTEDAAEFSSHVTLPAQEGEYAVADLPASESFGIGEAPPTEDFSSIPYVYDPAVTTEPPPHGYTPVKLVGPTNPPPPFYDEMLPAEASLVAWDNATTTSAGTLTLPGGPASRPDQGPKLPLSTFPAFQPRFLTNDGPRARSGVPFWVLALASLACLGLGALASYLVINPGAVGVNAKPAPAAGRLPAPTALPEAAELKSGDQEGIDAAFAANKAGHFAEAAKLFTALIVKHPQWVGLGIEVGRAQLYQHDLASAGTTLKDALNKGQAPGDANFLLGLLYMTNGSFPDAEASYAKAVAIDPTRPDFYYFWGECLRREGKPLEAVARFRAALLRNQYETAEGLYRLKLWLSSIQSDQEKTDGTNAQIDAGLARTRPPMEALLAAAVRSIKADQIKEAAGFMARAQQVVEPTLFFVVMQDPSFAQESWRPELAEFYQPGAPAALSSDSAAAATPETGATSLPSKPEPPAAKGK